MRPWRRSQRCRRLESSSEGSLLELLPFESSREGFLPELRRFSAFEDHGADEESESSSEGSLPELCMQPLKSS